MLVELMIGVVEMVRLKMHGQNTEAVRMAVD